MRHYDELLLDTICDDEDGMVRKKINKHNRALVLQTKDIKQEVDDGCVRYKI